MSEEMNVNVNPEAEELSEEKIGEQRQIRREKLKKLQEAGRNPFIHETWNVTAHSMDIKDNFDAMEDQEVSGAGRVAAPNSTKRWGVSGLTSTLPCQPSAMPLQYSVMPRPAFTME